MIEKEVLQLVQKAKAGDHAAFEELWKANRLKVSIIVKARLGYGNNDVPDVVQNIFFSAFKQIGRLKEETRFFSWLYHIASISCMDYLRQQPRNAIQVSIDKASGLAGPTSWNEAVLSQMIIAENVMKEMGEREQKILHLVLWEGHSPAVVAKNFGTQPNRIYEIIKLFRRKLKASRTELVLDNAWEPFISENTIIGTVVQTANTEIMRWLQKHPEDLLRVHPGTFEQIVAEIFRDQGFEVDVLGSWNQADGGIDIIAARKDTLTGDFRVGIQCKRYIKTHTVKADVVWALEGRLEKFKLNKGVLATTASFENAVLSDLKDHLWRIELRDFEILKKDLQSWGLYQHGSSGLWLPRV